MEALAAEARKIEAEMEEFSRRTAKEVAGLVMAISEIEDESDEMIKREKNIDLEMGTLAKEKEAVQFSLRENDKRLKSLSSKKEEMDKMVDSEMKKLRERDREIKEILNRLSNSEAENRPDSPSLLLDPSSQELDEEDQELVDVLAQMVEEARVSTSLVKSNPDVGGETGVNTILATNLNQSTGSAPSGSAGANRHVEGTEDDRVGQPPQVHRASSATTGNICTGTTSGIGNSPLSSVRSSNIIISSKTPSSEPWWASRKVRLRSKTGTVSTPALPDDEAERRTGGAESVETRSENVPPVAVDGFEKGKNAEEISEEEGVGNESEESAGKEDKGSSSKEGKEGAGGKKGKSRGARRAEKRKLRRENSDSTLAASMV